MRRTLAVTGGTGFVGTALIGLAVEAGWQVRALARSPQPDAPGVVWIAGALDDAASLDALVAGAEAIVHAAGLTNAADRAAFALGNVAGTEAMLAAATRAGVARFVHVSSLSARAPGLSDYGWSKAEAEARVRTSGLDWTMVRPPAIYGPGDRDHLELFRFARMGLVPLPPAGRMSAIHVRDLARLLLALAAADATGRVFEVDDGAAGGWSHGDYGRAIADAAGRRALLLPLPAALVRAAAKVDRAVRGAGARLTPDRAAYFCHPDWVIDPAARPDPALWTPQVETRAGLAETAEWYRAAGWL